MINWLLGLDSLNAQIQSEYIEQLKSFLIKEDLAYLAAFFQESNSLSSDYDPIGQFYFWTKFFIW